MSNVNINGQIIEYESLGSAKSPTILLIMGLGMQLTNWPDAFCQRLVDAGFRVIRFDNRDIGLSGKVHVGRRVNMKLALLAAFLKLPVRAPYLLDDMVADTVGLLDALEIKSAHVVGASMGGMIAQLMAAHHPTRVISLTSVMSSSGNRRAHRGTPEAMRVLMARPTDASNISSVIEHTMKVYSVIGSPGYPQDKDELHARITRNFNRSYHPAGTARQLLAIMASGDRRRLLQKISAPTLVIHGADDKLVPVAAGRDTAHHIKGANLLVVPGMGHDLPPGLQPVLADAISAHCMQHAEKAAS